MGRLDRGGTIEPGKQADLIVIDRNPLTAPQALWPGTVLGRTGGQRLHLSAGESPRNDGLGQLRDMLLLGAP